MFRHEAMARRLRTGSPALRAALAAAAVFAVHHQVYGIPFLYSEIPGIEQSSVVTSLATFWERMVTPRGLLARPLSVLSYALDHAVHGTEVWGYHLVNLVVHALNAILVVLLAARLGAAPLAAGLAFALHPLATACTSQIFGRNYSLATLFALGALLALVRWRQRGARLGPARLGILAALVLAAFGSKQTLVFFPAVLVWWELCRPDQGPGGARGRPRWAVVAPLAGLAGVLGLVATWLYAVPLSATAAIEPRGFALSQLGNVDALAGLYVLPYRTALVHDLFAYDDPLDPAAVRGAVALGLAVAAAWRWRRYPAGWLLGAFLLCLAPTNSILPKNEVVREWRLYPSLAFFALLVGCGIAWLQARPRRWAVPLVAATWGWIGVLAHASTVQDHHYRSRLTAWTQVLARYPHSADAMNNLGTLYYERGEPERARALFARAVGRAPRVSLFRKNLARAWAGLGDAVQARHHARLAGDLERRYGPRTMAVHYADGRPQALPPELARVADGPPPAPATPLERARAPRRLARVVPRAEFPGGARFANLYHEGSNAAVRGEDGAGSGTVAAGKAVAERWRALAGDVAGLFVLRDALFAQQDHPLDQRAYALTLPTDWLVAAVAAVEEGRALRALEVPRGDDDAAWTAVASPEALFGVFPPSGSLYRWATAPTAAVVAGLRPRVAHARHALRRLAAYTARLEAAAPGGAQAVAAEGSAIVAEQDRRYFGATLRRTRIVPILVTRAARDTSDAERRAAALVHRTVLRRRLRHGDGAAASYDLAHADQRRAALGLARDVLVAGGGRLWLWLTASADGAGAAPQSEVDLAAIDALRAEVRAAGVDVARLRFVVRVGERPADPDVRRAALVQRVDEYAAPDVYVAVELLASEVLATMFRDGVPVDFGDPLQGP